MIRIFTAPRIFGPAAIRQLDYSTMSSTVSSDSNINVLIYILRRDLRLEDNPVFHALASNPGHLYPHTHLLPVYIFPAQQVEVSGFIPGGLNAGPDALARSKTGKFWRCGEHRVKFLAESVWALKGSLQSVGSDLEIRVGMLAPVLSHMVDGLSRDLEGGRKCKVTSVWMTKEEGPEERQEENECKKVCESAGINFRLWNDEKYLTDEYVVLPDCMFSSAILLSCPCITNSS